MSEYRIKKQNHVQNLAIPPAVEPRQIPIARAPHLILTQVNTWGGTPVGGIRLFYSDPKPLRSGCN